MIGTATAFLPGGPAELGHGHDDDVPKLDPKRRESNVNLTNFLSGQLLKPQTNRVTSA